MNILLIVLAFMACKPNSLNNNISKSTEVDTLDIVTTVMDRQTDTVNKTIPSEEIIKEIVIGQKGKVETTKQETIETKELPTDINKTNVPNIIIKPEEESVRPELESIDKQKIEEVNVVDEKVVGLHDEWNSMLNKYVASSGIVNYKSWKADESRLDKYLDNLSKNYPSENWSKNKELAYWINAYNSFTVKLILKNYPLRSITEIDKGKPWDTKWIKLGSKTYSLNNIENDIIRPKFKDPRIHFAVNCAAISCPPLSNNAFNEENVNSLLERMTQKYINSSANVISAESLKISKIFEWYAVDFGDIATFFNKYSNKKVDRNATISYLEYNWDLNGK